MRRAVLAAEQTLESEFAARLNSTGTQRSPAPQSAIDAHGLRCLTRALTVMSESFLPQSLDSGYSHGRSQLAHSSASSDCATALAAERRRPERCKNRDQELKREPFPCLINSAGSSTYPARKSVRSTRATPFPPATKTSGHRAGVHRRSAVHFVTAGDGAPPWQRPRARSLSRELLVTGKSWQASATASLRALTSSPRQGPARAGIRVHCSSPPSQRCGARAKQSACHRDRWAFPWTATRS
jgi:hypothetical protein